MQALAVVGLEEGSACLFVVPRLIGRAGLHGREDMHQPRLLTATGQHLLDPVFLAEVALADVVDLQSGLCRQPLGVLPHWSRNGSAKRG